VEKIKLGFTDMWGYAQYNFNPADNYFTDLFCLDYDVQIDNKNPDLLLYSVFGKNHKKYSCKKIFICGENLKHQKQDLEHYENSDINLSQYNDEEKDLFFPLWVLSINWFNKSQPRPFPSNPTYTLSVDQIQNNRERFLHERKFCSFISNREYRNRVEIFNALSKVDRIDSFGSLLNNVEGSLGGSQQEKIEKLKEYKFNIAFENSYHDGYITEKILEPFGAGCIPLYSGGSKVKRYFNKNSFVCREDYNSIEEYVNKIVSIHSDSQLYQKMILEKPMLDQCFIDFDPKIILKKIIKKL
tara:strand:+ start:6012 stop:6908 length:897 start_codon:yes stop_codon:yes gene_type:complete